METLPDSHKQKTKTGKTVPRYYHPGRNWGDLKRIMMNTEQHYQMLTRLCCLLRSAFSRYDWKDGKEVGKGIVPTLWFSAVSRLAYRWSEIMGSRTRSVCPMPRDPWLDRWKFFYSPERLATATGGPSGTSPCPCPSPPANFSFLPFDQNVKDLSNNYILDCCFSRSLRFFKGAVLRAMGQQWPFHPHSDEWPKKNVTLLNGMISLWSTRVFSLLGSVVGSQGLQVATVTRGRDVPFREMSLL